jgi:hypothetical protein
MDPQQLHNDIGRFPWPWNEEPDPDDEEVEEG